MFEIRQLRIVLDSPHPAEILWSHQRPEGPPEMARIELTTPSVQGK